MIKATIEIEAHTRDALVAQAILAASELMSVKPDMLNYDCNIRGEDYEITSTCVTEDIDGPPHVEPLDG